MFTILGPLPTSLGRSCCELVIHHFSFSSDWDVGNITAVTADLKYFHFSFSSFLQCLQTLAVPPLSPCYQAKLFLIFPNSSIAKTHPLLTSRSVSFLKFGMGFSCNGKEETLLLGTKLPGIYFSQNVLDVFSWDEPLHGFLRWCPACYFPHAFPLFLQIPFIFSRRLFVKIRQI